MPSLLCPTLDAVIDLSKVIFVRIAAGRAFKTHAALKLVNLPNRELLQCSYEGRPLAGLPRLIPTYIRVGAASQFPPIRETPSST